MMDASNLATGVAFALAAAVAMAAAFTALTSANAVKRVVSIVVALIGAMLASAALAAPAQLVVAAGALAFAFCAVGVALIVRLQEAYGAVEVGDFDSADEQSELREPEA
jgi:hypothetical protein